MFEAASKDEGLEVAADALVALFHSPPHGSTPEDDESHERYRQVGALLLADGLRRLRVLTS